MARHIDWVYSAARRRVGDAQLAEDVTQAVFIALDQNQKLNRKTIVASWLFGVLRYTASKVIRDQSRRNHHERAAALMRRRDSGPGAEPWDEESPLLESAVDSLGRRDQQVIMLRFYQGCSLAEVGQALGISEEGARKRIARAIRKLQHFFSRQGVGVPAAGLADAMVAHCVHPAPATLASSIASGSRASSIASKLALSWQAGVRLHVVRIFAAIAGTGAAVIVAFFVLFQLLAPRPLTPQASVAAPATQPLASDEPATRPATLTLNQIIAGIRKSETQFQNVHVKDFLTTMQNQPHGQTAWISTRIRYTGSAWYGPDARGPRRIYFTDIVLPWEQGTAPWAEQLTDEGWDGHEGIYLNLAGGPLGRIVRLRTAMLWSNVPPDLDDYAPEWSGAGYTLQYQVRDEDLVKPVKPRTSLADQLELLSKVKPDQLDPKTRARLMRLDVADQSMNGFDAVRVRMSWGSPTGVGQPKFFGSNTYWFDPSRGYALVKTQLIMELPNQSRTEGIDVFEFKQAGPGIWFPIRGQSVREDPPDGYGRWTYQASDVIVNNPKFDASIFRPKIPSGWLVTDDRTQTSRNYVTREDGSELETHRGVGLPRMKAGVATRPDGETPAIVSDPRAAW
jgi:RNA polymerase sigma factor (sigma-70 family)